MFNFRIEIYDYNSKTYVDYTKYGVFPLKCADLLDEQLDEAEVQLRGVPVEAFQQQTPVKITIYEVSENPYTQDMKNEIAARADSTDVAIDLQAGILFEDKEINMLIATDHSFQSPRGIKNVNGDYTYTHTLYLIEETKILERFIGEGLTFTNTISNEWLSASHLVNYSIQETSDPAVLTYKQSTIYYSPWDKKTDLTILRLDSFFDNQLQVSYAAIFGSYFYTGAGVYITDGNGKNVYKQYLVSNGNSDYGFDVYQQVGENAATKLNNGSGLNTSGASNSWVNYTLHFDKNISLYVLYTSVNPSRIDTSSPANKYAIRTNINVVEGLYPVKKRTVKDVINRCLSLIEPIKKGGNPRFVLATDEATRLDNIIAPEYAMTRMTLREQLKLVGGTIHGEPRIKSKTADATVKGGWRYTIGFDYYGQTTESHIKDRYCVSDEANADINDYATELDSSVENLVNQLDWAQGVVTEPFSAGSLTLRAEEANVRLEDTDVSFIQTDLPIYSLLSENGLVYCGQGINNNGTVTWYDAKGTLNGTETVDISAYAFEATDYANTLSAYEPNYPYSRAYAVYYTQGQKGIKGLWFKPEAAAFQAFQKYSIVNIIRAAGGTVQESNYPLLRFRVSYLPVAATRVKTHKSVVMKGAPSTIVYNQAANLVESKYYGENLKGVIARLGNVEKTKTYLLGHLSDMPQIGLLYDEQYYISAVRWELRPTHIICTVGLSKDFNRLSEYVGISSNKRMWEVSERQIQRRETVYNPKIVISRRQYDNDGIYLIATPAKLLLNKRDYSGVGFNGIGAHIKTFVEGNKITEVLKSVISVPLGNSMVFTCQLEDNYSAGQHVEFKADGGASIEGWWTKYSPYVNYYGRFDSLVFAIEYITGANSGTAINLPEVVNYQPLSSILIGAARKEGQDNFYNEMLYDKDNREIPQLTMEVTALSDDPKIIIGSALMSNCNLANKTPSKYALWLTDTLISPIISTVPFTGDDFIISEDDVSFPVTINNDNIVVTIPYRFSTNGGNTYRRTKAWALITELSYASITVANPDGTIDTQQIRKGGEIVLAGNFAPEGNTNATYTLYFNVRDDLETL